MSKTTTNFLSLAIIFLFLTIAVVTAGTAAAQQSDTRPRVYIEETDSWEVESEPVWGTTDKKGRTTISGGGTRGGAKPRTAETIKRFNEQCREVIVTMYKDKADFIVLLEHEGGKDLFNKDNKLAVFNRDGDLISSGSFSRPKKAVETACGAIQAEFSRQSGASQNER
ncbi:MAG TPA: hypothetical protein VIL74_07730 [Pyrinomonadaceae bacterium]|jgi:hypothetical protein